MAKKKFHSNEEIEDTLLPSEEEDILELDEVCSFVKERKNKKWLWVAFCRRTRQVVAYIIGDRSERSCRELWEVIPEKYKNLHSYSDFWDAYRKIFPVETHRSVGKESGETNHIERWNNTLRQRLGRYTRKTLSFSKSEFFHYVVTHLFVRKYNLSKT
jgi:IS1 family transposase